MLVTSISFVCLVILQLLRSANSGCTNEDISPDYKIKMDQLNGCWDELHESVLKSDDDVMLRNWDYFMSNFNRRANIMFKQLAPEIQKLDKEGKLMKVKKDLKANLRKLKETGDSSDKRKEASPPAPKIVKEIIELERNTLEKLKELWRKTSRMYIGTSGAKRIRNRISEMMHNTVKRLQAFKAAMDSKHKWTTDDDYYEDVYDSNPSEESGEGDDEEGSGGKDDEKGNGGKDDKEGKGGKKDDKEESDGGKGDEEEDDEEEDDAPKSKGKGKKPKKKPWDDD